MTLELLLIGLAAGALILIPSLRLLFKTFSPAREASGRGLPTTSSRILRYPLALMSPSVGPFWSRNRCTRLSVFKVAA